MEAIMANKQAIALLMKAFNSIGAEGFGRLITRKFTGTSEEDFLKFVKELPWTFRELVIFAIQNEGVAFDLAAAGVESIIELSRFNPLLKVAAEGTVEGLVEGLPAFISANLSGRERKAYKGYLVDQIRQGVPTEEKVGKRGHTHNAGKACVREDNLVHWTYNPECHARSDHKIKPGAEGSFRKMQLAHGEKILCESCFSEAPAGTTARQVVIEQVAAPPPPTAPNWIREVSKNKRASLLGLYMAAEDHKTFDAPEEQENQPTDSKLDKGTTTEKPVVKKSEDASKAWPVWQMGLAVLYLIFTMAVWFTYGNGAGLVALGASCVLVTISASLSWFWRISRFQAKTSKANNRFENLDGLAFRLAYVLEWMAKNRPADLNLLLKSGVTFQEARDNATEKFPELISAALLVGRGEKIIPWWVSVADMADVAIQMPVLRRWARMAFASGGTIAVRAAVLATLFILLPLVFVYGAVILIAVFLLASGIAGFLHTFGVTETHSILGALTKIVSGDISVHGMELTASGDYEVPFWGLVISAGKIWAFRFLIIPFVAPIEGLFTGGEAAKISRYSGKEHITMRILRIVNNMLPESVRISIAPPSRLSPAELLELKQITGNPRVKHVALIVVLLGATAAFMGFLYRFMTFQSPLASVMVCMVLMVALLAEVTAMLGYLSDIVRKATQFFMIQDTMLNAFKAFVVVVIFVGAATAYTTTRSYSVHSARYDKWAQEELSKAQAPSTPKAKPASTRRSKAAKPKEGIDQAACKRFPDLCK